MSLWTVACAGDAQESPTGGTTTGTGETTAPSEETTADGTSSGETGSNPGTGSDGASDSSPGAPQDVHFVVARFDGGVESWSLVGPVDLEPYVAALDPNGDVVLALRSYEGAPTDSRLVRVSEGELVDELIFEQSAWLRMLEIDASGTIYVAGTFDDRTGYAAFDQQFDEHWPVVTTGDAGSPRPVGLALGPDGSVVYAGWSDELAAPIVSKVDSDGTTAWTTERPGLSEVPADAYISGTAVHPDGTTVIALTTGGEDASMVWLDAFGPNGSPAWAAERMSTVTGGIALSTAGNFVVSGYEILFEGGEIFEHLWLGAFDTSGTKLWEVLSEPLGYLPLHACGDGFIMLDIHGLQAVTIDAQGEPAASVSYEHEGFLRGTEAFCTSDGGIILVGSTTVPE